MVVVTVLIDVLGRGLGQVMGAVTVVLIVDVEGRP